MATKDCIHGCREKRCFYCKFQGALAARMHRHVRTAREDHGMIKKKKTCLEYLGCSIEDFRKHIEKQFFEGMTWGNGQKMGSDNVKVWEFDHRKPIASFDFINNNEEEAKKCFHFSNYQPIWPINNKLKGDDFELRNFAYVWKNEEEGWVLK